VLFVDIKLLVPDIGNSTLEPVVLGGIAMDDEKGSVNSLPVKKLLPVYIDIEALFGKETELSVIT
tara:strand:- start:7 stop:201 length:195 start_codon:yes stop_codon:yes gene_type:complete